MNEQLNKLHIEKLKRIEGNNIVSNNLEQDKVKGDEISISEKDIDVKENAVEEDEISITEKDIDVKENAVEKDKISIAEKDIDVKENAVEEDEISFSEKDIDVKENAVEEDKISEKDIDVKENAVEQDKCKDSCEENIKRCRICYEGDQILSPLISPCKCNGTIKWVHEKCIKEWINISKKKYCPQCRYQYKIENVCNYPKLSFLCKDRNIRFLSLLTMFTIILIISIFKYYLVGMKSNSKINFFLDGLKGLIILSFIIVPIMYYKKWIDMNSIYTELYNTSVFSGSSVGDISGFIFLVINHIMKNTVKKYIKFEEKIQNYVS